MDDASPDVVARLSELSRATSRALRKAEKRAAAIGSDLAAIDDAEAWAARAPWLVAAASRAPRGSTHLAVPDWSTGEERQLELPLDPARSAHEQVEAIFHEARRLRRARPQVEARLARARDDVAKLTSALADLTALSELASAPNADAVAVDDLEAELETLRERVRPLLPRGATLPGDKPPPHVRLPYREFVVSGGIRVLVGRDAKSNDELTLHVAKPYHLWLHAKGLTGSHVVACIQKGHSITPEQLVDAAHLAAHFSDARGEPVVDVSYVPRRYLRKPRKSPPGAVVLDREKVLVLRVEPERLKRLLGDPV